MVTLRNSTYNKTTLIELSCHQSSMETEICLRDGEEASLSVKTDRLSLYFLQMRENWWLGFQLTSALQPGVEGWGAETITLSLKAT